MEDEKGRKVVTEMINDCISKAGKKERERKIRSGQDIRRLGKFDSKKKT